MDPYLHLIVRQPLPKFAMGRWEAIADCNNLFAQGMSRPAAGMAGLFSCLHSVRFEVGSAFSFRNYWVLESCISPSRNWMMRDSPAFRYNKLLNIKEFRE